MKTKIVPMNSDMWYRNNIFNVTDLHLDFESIIELKMQI